MEDKISIVIHLDDGDQMAKAGTEISGVVHLCCDESVLRITNISVGFRGEAKASWVSKVSDKIFDSCEPLMEQKIDNQGFPLDEVNVREKVSIPFQFALPADSPSSTETRFGYIRYEVYASVDAEICLSAGCFISSNDRQFRNVLAIRTVPVLAVVDRATLLSLPSLATKAEEQFEDLYCCWRPALLLLQLEIADSVLTTGQLVNVHVVINNHSRRQVTGCLLMLVQQVQCHAQSRYEEVADCRLVANEVCSVDLANVAPDKAFDQNVSLKIPNDVVPFNVRPCMVTVAHRIVLRVRSGRVHEIGLPVYVSNVP